MKRPFTRMVSKAARRYKPMALLSVLCMGGAANAQTWKGEQLPEAGGDFYLYNKASGKFLQGGYDWGTRATPGDPGYLCTMTLDNGKYYVRAVYGKGTGNLYLQNNGSASASVDGQKRNYTFTAISSEGESTEYTIGVDENQLLRYDGKTFSFNGKVLDGIADDETWLLVSKEQRISALADATAEKGIDASFYIKHPNFGWKEYGDSWKIESGLSWNWTSTYGNAEVVVPNQTANQYNYCTQFWEFVGDFYQELTDVPNGRYTLECQGFYRPGANVTSEAVDNLLLYADDATVAIQNLTDDGKGDVPNSQATAANAFAQGRYAENKVEVIVTNGRLRIGLKKEKWIAKDWACFDTFKLTYYGAVEDYMELYKDAMAKLSLNIERFTAVGAEKIVSDLSTLHNQHKETTEYKEAVDAVTPVLENIDKAYIVASELQAALNNVEEKVSKRMEALTDEMKTEYNRIVSSAQDALKTADVNGMLSSGAEAKESLKNVIPNVYQRVCWKNSLQSALVLADRIGNMEETEAYKKVSGHLHSFELSYDVVKADVKALIEASYAKITPDFLATVSADNPIDMTCFIVNPNIYQANKKAVDPDGWTLLSWSEVRDHTSEEYMDTELSAYSWSGNATNNIGKNHFQQLIGDGGVGGVKLPNGVYELSAATYITPGSGTVCLYASSNAEGIGESEVFNRDKDMYDGARWGLNTTTTVKNIVVRDGKLYVGVRGYETVLGAGRSWNADNFRLSYVGALDEVPVTFKAEYGTLTLPFDAPIQEGMEVLTVESAAEGGQYRTLQMTKVEEKMAANTPYVIRKTGEKTDFVYSGLPVAASDNLSNGLLTGVLETMYAPMDSYVLQNQTDKGLGFYRVSADNKITINPYRAYLTMPAVTAEVLGFVFDWGGPTSVGAAVAEDNTPVDVYSVSGVLVRKAVKASEALDGLSKGLYIVNGVKKVVK